jgi:hypothetical protein
LDISSARWRGPPRKYAAAYAGGGAHPSRPVISTFQIGAALGVAIVGGVFFSALGSGQDVAAYTHAFAVALGCNVALLVFGGVLSLWLPGEPRIAELPSRLRRLLETCR